MREGGSTQSLGDVHDFIDSRLILARPLGDTSASRSSTHHRFPTPILNASHPIGSELAQKAQNCIKVLLVSPVPTRRRAAAFRDHLFTVTMCRAICIASHEDPSYSPTLALPTRRPRRSAVEKVHYEQDVCEPRTYPPYRRLNASHAPRPLFRTTASRFVLTSGVTGRTGSSGNISVFRLMITTILRGSSTPLPWKGIFRYVVSMLHALPHALRSTTIVRGIVSGRDVSVH